MDNKNIEGKDNDTSYSHVIYDSWEDLFRNIAIVILIGVFTWAMSFALLLIIVFCLDHIFYLFDPGTTISIGSFVLAPELILFCILFAAALLRNKILKKQYWGQDIGDGINSARKNLHEPNVVTEHTLSKWCVNRYKKHTFLAGLRRCILTILTVGSGGSGGVEGPIVAIGENIGAGFSKIFKILSYYNMQVFQMTGIAVAVTTLLHVPFAGAIFAVEIVFGDRFMYRPVFFALLGCLVAFSLNNFVGYYGPFANIIEHTNEYSIIEFIGAIVIAITCSGPTGVCMIYFIHYLRKITSNISSTYLVLFGAAAVWFFSVILWRFLDIHPLYIIGMGEKALIYFLQAESAVYGLLTLIMLVIVKIVLTGCTIVALGSAGLLLPAMYIGGTMGGVVYYCFMIAGVSLVDTNMITFIIIGMACSLVSVIEVPLAAIIFIMETFGANYSPPVILSCVISHLLIRRYKFYAQSGA